MNSAVLTSDFEKFIRISSLASTTFHYIEMSSIVLSRSLRILRAGSVTLPLLYPSLQIRRAASLNHGIGRGLRRSKGVGFRGKERSPTVDRNLGARYDIIRRSADPPRKPISGQQMTGDGWEGKRRGRSSGAPLTIRRGAAKTVVRNEQGLPATKSRAARFYDPNSSFGKESLAKKRAATEDTAPRTNGFERGSGSERSGRRPRGSVDQQKSRGFQPRAFGERREQEQRTSKDKYPSLSARQPSLKARSRSSDSTFGGGKELEQRTSGDRYPPLSTREPSYNTRSRDSDSGSPSGRYETRAQETRVTSRDKNSSSTFAPQTSPSNQNNNSSTSRPRFDNQIPLSIPYTTPASEFLYGTSVVEAAMSSRSVPRRKLYKLYIHTGENRESADRDAGIGRLARKNCVEVVHVENDWLRLMDKMSAGRPHNGYILEASPLPRLPVISLGEIAFKDGQPGFEVVLDHQSREEAAVNGTSSFIRVPRNPRGRKPFVILLDSILDPGNLGGIIRTASFLGVSAIAISTRNCAPFSPVVLKASAGASENVTLFSVNKPQGFIVDSKLAGWKVFAAVAPSGKRDSNMPTPMSTDELEDPLADEPCILMLGSEGEGLRWNLRSKADVDLSIRGCGQSHNVDSLNVSVATGILCNSFLRGSNSKRSASWAEPQIQLERDVEPVRDLF
jgi:21S rRNA (GM2251-2'-O)-methyltransferase